MLAAEQLGDVGPGGQQGLVEIEIVRDLADHSRAHGHGRGRRRCIAPFRRHADLVGCELLAPGDGIEDLAGSTLLQMPPVDSTGSPQLVRVVSECKNAEPWRR